MSDVDDELLKQLGEALRESINEDALDDYAKEHEWRSHLGISIIGQECLRKTWYDFRWFTYPEPKPHQLRIFGDGHQAEPAIVAMLQRNGFDISTTDPATGKQWLYSAVHGHYGGSSDGIINGHTPELAGRLGPRILLEAKSHNSKSFTHLVSHGVVDSKPQHYTQMCGYGYGFQLQYGLYFAVNKNDGDIYTQFVRLNWQYAMTMELRAEGIITARQPPARVSNKSTDYRCKMCDHIAVCHGKQQPVVTCRSCRNAYPTDRGEWTCALYQQVIPRHIVTIGCPQYERLEHD